VVARCGNLPTHIRNGEQIGGGYIVGWLPIVSALNMNRYLRLLIVLYTLRFLSWHLRRRSLPMCNSSALFGIVPF